MTIRSPLFEVGIYFDPNNDDRYYLYASKGDFEARVYISEGIGFQDFSNFVNFANMIEKKSSGDPEENTYEQ